MLAAPGMLGERLGESRKQDKSDPSVERGVVIQRSISLTPEAFQWLFCKTAYRAFPTKASENSVSFFSLTQEMLF